MLATLAAFCLMNQVSAPAPLLPIPSKRQLAWHRLETYAFVHFSINTFTDREWGEGNENPKLFAPTALNVEQWVKTFKAAGMKMLILTAKHHDGLCMWPSKQSAHTVAASGIPNRDVLGEVSKACKKHGLKLGVYLSPWDRNHPKYGTPEYNDVFVKQLEEVLSNYGPVHEVWFDGANGEGPNGKKQVYDWPRFHATVRRLQPDACMFSDAGPDVRWVGNESGFSAETCWAMVPSGRYVPGTPHYKELTEGSETGDAWIPAECDVSIRPGWFYHASQDDKVKTVEQLVDLYFRSVGQNANFLLNVPPDRRGLIHENDVKALLGWRKWLDFTFAKDLARGAGATASVERNPLSSQGRGSDEVRGEGWSPTSPSPSPRSHPSPPAPLPWDGRGEFGAANLTDGKDSTYWAAPDGVLAASLKITFGKEAIFDVIQLQEHIELGQRVKKFNVEALTQEGWRQIAQGTTVGYNRLLRLPQTIKANAIRVNIEDARACPTLHTIGVYASPDVIRRELGERVKKDQDIRTKVDWTKPSADEVHAIEKVDGENLVYLKALVAKYGWLGSSLLTPKGGHDLWLLVQHMDAEPAFQEKCLKLMEPQVQAGEASGKDFAYLTDRVLRAQNKPQRYGTQLKSDGKGGFEVQPNEDPENLDKRRAAVGMGTMKEYLLYATRVNDPKQRPQVDLLLSGWKEINAGADGSFTLPAKLAKVVGKKAAYEEATDAIGYWTDAADQVGWLLNGVQRGNFKLRLQFACDPGDAGSVIEVNVGGETKTFTVPPTGGWAMFEWAELGQVALVTPGLTEVRVRVKSMAKGAVMNLRQVSLFPLRSETAKFHRSQCGAY